jgi:beta-phosphoglucomutase-like phosphatase (HAD superfamily)
LNFPTQECIVFEDSLSGILSARAAGTKVVGVATTHTPKELEHTDFVITDFTDLDPSYLIRTLFPA